MSDEEREEHQEYEGHDEHEGASPLVTRLFFGAIALLGVGLIGLMLWPREGTSPESQEYVQWYNLGYETGKPIGRSAAESKEPILSPEKFTEMAVSKRKAAGAANVTQSAAYERGFAFGYTDGFHAVQKPGL